MVSTNVTQEKSTSGPFTKNLLIFFFFTLKMFHMWVFILITLIFITIMVLILKPFTKKCFWRLSKRSKNVNRSVWWELHSSGAIIAKPQPSPFCHKAGEWPLRLHLQICVFLTAHIRSINQRCKIFKCIKANTCTSVLFEKCSKGKFS